MSGCCRIDPIHHGGIYIPLLAPVFRCLPPPLSFFLPLRSPSRAHQPHHRRGGFSRATAYAATFLGALAQASLPLPFLPSPRLCNYQDPLATPPPPHPLVVSLEDATAIVYASNLFTPDATTFRPRSWRGAVVSTIFWNFRSCDRELLRPAMCSRRLLRSLDARERRSKEICPLAS